MKENGGAKRRFFLWGIIYSNVSFA